MGKDGKEKDLNEIPMDNRQPSLTKPKFVSPLELLKDVKDLNGNVPEVPKVNEEMKRDSISSKKDVNENVLRKENCEKNSANLRYENSFNLLDYTQKLRNTDSKFFKLDKVGTKLTMELPKLGKPIGIALLPKSKKMVIGDTASNHVKIFSREGDFLNIVNPP